MATSDYRMMQTYFSILESIKENVILGLSD